MQLVPILFTTTALGWSSLLSGLICAQQMSLSEGFVAVSSITPIKAPANGDLAPIAAFTMEECFVLARTRSSAWLVGEYFATSASTLPFALMLDDEGAKLRSSVSAVVVGSALKLGDLSARSQVGTRVDAFVPGSWSTEPCRSDC